MKSVILASGIFILIIILMFSSYIYTERLTDQMNGFLDENEKYFAKNDWDSAENEIKLLSKTWNKSRNIMAAFVNHTVIDEIDECITKISVLVKMHETADYYAEVGRARLKINGLYNLQKVSIANLF